MRGAGCPSVPKSCIVLHSPDPLMSFCPFLPRSCVVFLSPDPALSFSPPTFGMPFCPSLLRSSDPWIPGCRLSVPRMAFRIPRGLPSHSETPRCGFGTQFEFCCEMLFLAPRGRKRYRERESKRKERSPKSRERRKNGLNRDLFSFPLDSRLIHPRDSSPRGKSPRMTMIGGV